MIEEWMNRIVWSWLLVFLRSSGFVLMIPVLSVRQVPIFVRVALSAIFAYLISVLSPVALPIPEGWMDVIFLLSAEVLTGLLLGFFIRLIFYGFEMAGQIITMEAGLGMSNLFNPFEGQSSPIFSSLMFYFSVVIFLVLDLHHEVIAGFFKSYEVIGPGATVMSEALAGEIVQRSVKLFWIALEMAAPIICVSFMVTLMFSVFGRAVPQMNVFVLSFPIRVLGSVIVFGLSVNLFFGYINQYFSYLPGDIAGLLRLMSGA